MLYHLLTLLLAVVCLAPASPVWAECGQITTWTYGDASAFGADPMGWLTADSTPNQEYIAFGTSSSAVTVFTSPSFRPHPNWSTLVTIYSYPDSSAATTDFDNDAMFTGYAPSATAAFLTQEANRWLFGQYRDSSKSALYNVTGYALYHNNIIKVSAGTSPGSETGASVPTSFFTTVLGQAQALIDSKCGDTLPVGNHAPAIEFVPTGAVPYVSGAVTDDHVSWGIIFRDEDGVSDIDFGSLTVTVKTLATDPVDISGGFLTMVLELVNQGKASLVRSDTELAVVCNTTFDEIRGLLFVQDAAMRYDYIDAYQVTISVADQSAENGTASAGFWLGKTPWVDFRAVYDADGNTVDHYHLYIEDSDGKSDLDMSSFTFTLDGIDFTSYFIDRVVTLLPSGLTSLSGDNWGYTLDLDYQPDLLCNFFYNASGTLGFTVADRHGYQMTDTFVLSCP